MDDKPTLWEQTQAWFIVGIAFLLYPAYRFYKKYIKREL